jgi:hypothetical protein
MALGDKWSSAFLEYDESDPRANSYESALKSIVDSVTAVPSEREPRLHGGAGGHRSRCVQRLGELAIL